MGMFRRYERLAELAGGYSGFILDLWGVIHDGQALYPDVLPALEALRERGKRIVFLSNAPRRAAMAEAVLQRLGVPQALYDGIVTSGEAAFDYVCKLTENSQLATSQYYYIGPDKDANILYGLPLSRTLIASEAAFAIVTGYDQDHSPLDEKEGDISACLEAELPLLCANPDHYVVRHSGVRVPCAGLIAETYAERGGRVTFFGKPHKVVYTRCLDLLGVSTENTSDVLAIGDNLDTDILGASMQGLDSILVTGGVLLETFGTPFGILPESPALENAFKEVGVYPGGVLPAFRW
ncbi:MAG: TIGR01459 family HAD-type hydrolase [Hyphomicrobiales bacterium]|nr:TIGR01459 family HAD-type hydrolase [Hyphomicrobiales bacterium]